MVFVGDGTLFLSTPSARRATAEAAEATETKKYFYPRPPRGGRRDLYRFIADFGVFLSTPSARRATSCSSSALFSERNFYPRPPRGGRLTCFSPASVDMKFLSTPSARRATRVRDHQGSQQVISIHALREEGDPQAASLPTSASNFYPRPPRGGRRVDIRFTSIDFYFYPRPPRGGRRWLRSAA